MSPSADDTQHRGPALRLTQENWNTWIAMVKNMILAIDHDEAAHIWQAYDCRTAVGDVDPAELDYQIATNAAERKLRMAHNKAFKIRSSATR